MRLELATFVLAFADAGIATQVLQAGNAVEISGPFARSNSIALANDKLS